MFFDYTVDLQTPDGQIHRLTFSSEGKVADDSIKRRACAQLQARMWRAGLSGDMALAAKVVSVKKVRIG
jgi:hypothetical protein